MKIPSLTAELLAALGLPQAAMVQQRVPKKLLSERGASTPADRQLIQGRIDELNWVAALKPSNIGVSPYEDEQRSYVEVAILVLRLRPEAKSARTMESSFAEMSASVKRIAEMIHRAVPYPTVLLIEDGAWIFASMANIRWAQREADKTVLDGESVIVPISAALVDGRQSSLSAFLDAMALSRQPGSHMGALYQGWLDTLSAWQAAELTGRFVISESPSQAEERRAALRRCKELDGKISALRSAASKERQLARQVAANLEVKKLLLERQQIEQNL